MQIARLVRKSSRLADFMMIYRIARVLIDNIQALIARNESTAHLSALVETDLISQANLWPSQFTIMPVTRIINRFFIKLFSIRSSIYGQTIYGITTQCG